MTDHLTNARRVTWANAALREFRIMTGCGHEDSLGDLLCDLMHWADANNFDFEAALCRAGEQYRAELEEEAGYCRQRRPPRGAWASRNRAQYSTEIPRPSRRRRDGQLQDRGAL